MMKKKFKPLAIIVLLFWGVWLLHLTPTLPSCHYLRWLSLLPAQVKAQIYAPSDICYNCPSCSKGCLNMYSSCTDYDVCSVSECKCVCFGQCGDDDDTPPQPPDQVEAGQGRFGVFDPNTPDITVDFPPGAVDVPVEVRAAYTDLPLGVAPPAGNVVGAPFLFGAWIRGKGETVDRFNKSVVINVRSDHKPIHQLREATSSGSVSPSAVVESGDQLSPEEKQEPTPAESVSAPGVTAAQTEPPQEENQGSVPVTESASSSEAENQAGQPQLSMYDPNTQAWIKLCGRVDPYDNTVSGAVNSPTALKVGGNALLAVTIDNTPALEQSVDEFGKTTLSLPDSNFSFDVLAGTVEVGTHFEVTPLLNAPDSVSFKLLPTPVDIKACQADYATARKVRQITQFTKPIEVMFYYDANTLARAGGKNNLTIVSFQDRQWMDLEEFGVGVVRGDNAITVDSSNLGSFSLAVR
jgi:hypothetical protein